MRPTRAATFVILLSNFALDRDLPSSGRSKTPNGLEINFGGGFPSSLLPPYHSYQMQSFRHLLRSPPSLSRSQSAMGARSITASTTNGWMDALPLNVILPSHIIFRAILNSPLKFKEGLSLYLPSTSVAYFYKLCVASVHSSGQ